MARGLLVMSYLAKTAKIPSGSTVVGGLLVAGTCRGARSPAAGRRGFERARDSRSGPSLAPPDGQTTLLGRTHPAAHSAGSMSGDTQTPCWTGAAYERPRSVVCP